MQLRKLSHNIKLKPYQYINNTPKIKIPPIRQVFVISVINYVTYKRKVLETAGVEPTYPKYALIISFIRNLRYYKKCLTTFLTTSIRKSIVGASISNIKHS